MNTGLISSRYATALLDYAIASDQQDEVYARMKTLSEVFVSVPEFKNALYNSSIFKEDKKKIILTACGGDIIPSSLDKMIDLILENEREEVLQFIALKYVDIYRDRFKIMYGKLITAVPFSKENELKFLSRIKNIVKENLEIEPIVDPKIVGGFILYLNDYRWDASVLGELTRIKGNLKKLEVSGALDIEE